MSARPRITQPKPPTAREAALAAATSAGYHGDGARYMRLMVEARVNREMLARAWRAGVAAKERNALCVCTSCASATIDAQFRAILEGK